MLEVSPMATLFYNDLKKVKQYFPNRAYGTDVSLWQRILNWFQLEDLGLHFAYMKASQGFWQQDGAFSDPTFEKNWKDSEKTKMMRGAYHFLCTFRNPLIQAKFFSEIIGGKDYNGQLPPAADVEWKTTSPGMKTVALVYLFLLEVQRLTHIRPVIYTGPGYWNANLFTKRLIFYTYPDWCDSYDLWNANYPYVAAKTPYIPTAWKKNGWKIWQCGIGTLPGIVGKQFDLDIFNGTVDDLKAYALKKSPRLAIRNMAKQV